MWSFGVIMFVVLFGFPPFHGKDDSEIYKKIRKGFNSTTKKGYGAFFPQAIPASDAAKDLIARCLVTDAAKRLTATEALEHKWFHGQASEAPMIASVLKNLGEFTSSSSFKTAVLNLMSKDMSEEEIKEVQAQFKAIDADGDGTITVAELQAAVGKVAGEQNPSLDKIQEMMQAADLDGDGQLSYDVLEELFFLLLPRAFFV
jgi:calcium-dependent protein kinase